jgi:hypothetical protein
MSTSAGSAQRVGTVRRLLPVLLLPLGLIACGLASAPWLRAYPSSVLAVPLFGAALLSVLLPFVVVNVGVRRLWQTALIDLVGYLFFVTLVALREPTGYADLWTGLVHGPSQILSFALPLVNPRSLLVVPVTLCWLCGAIVGECIGRNWQSVLPYAALLLTFGLSYAATQRAVTGALDARRYDALLAGALLLALLLLRAVQTWVDQDVDRDVSRAVRGPGDAATHEPVLPVRGVAVGALVSVLVAGGAAIAVQSHAFPGRAVTPTRTPPIDRSQPLSPLAFVAGLRPANPNAAGTPLFTVAVDQPASRYITIGDVDSYSGDSWSFSRTFRPSGGVIPADPALPTTGHGAPVTQQYTIGSTTLAAAPWMPFMYRPRRVVGTGVDIDTDSGMVVPANGLHVGESYSVVSDPASRTLTALRGRLFPGIPRDPIYQQLPPAVQTSMGPVVTALAAETGASSSSPIDFLRRVSNDLRTSYGLAGARPPAGASSSSTAATRRPTTASSTPTPSPTPASGASAPTRVGGTSFAAVLASILGASRTATPEQYATLVALLARYLDVPARVVTGFRLSSRDAGRTPPTMLDHGLVDDGTYTVRTGDAWTWVEIPIQGRGWVVLDPTPSVGSANHPSSSVGPSAHHSTTAPPTNALVTSANQNGHQITGGGGPATVTHSVPVAAIVTIAAVSLVALVVLLLVVLLLRKAIRVRRRRHNGDPRRRIVGAWQESIDVLMEAGLPDVTALTSREIVAATERTFGAEPAERARHLGTAANVAVFSPRTWLDAAEADHAWQEHAALRRAVRRRLTVRQRVGARLRYHRPARSRQLVGPETWSAAARPAGQQARRSTGRHVASSRRH